jgi:ABC-type sugar transport system permease subunit
MTTLEAVRRRTPELPGIPLDRVVTMLVVWHITLAALTALLLAATLLGDVGPAGVAGTVVAAVLAVVVAAHLTTVPLLRARTHLGRALSLGLTYLTALAAAITALQSVRFFVGLDALADTFASGIPFLLVALVAWLFGAWDRVGPAPRRVARTVTGLALLAALIAVGLFPALATFVSRLGDVVVLGALVLVAAAAVVVRRTWQVDVAREFAETPRQRDTLEGLAFLSPNLLGFVAFFAGPLLFSLVISFFQWDALGDKSFLGLDNYVRILSLDFSFSGDFSPGYTQALTFGPLDVGARDPLFWGSVWNVLKFTALALPASVIPAIFLAIALNSDLPGIKVIRALYFIPSIAGVVAVALIWRQLLNATVGYVNYGIAQFVEFYNTLPFGDVTDPEVQWLSDADVALYSLVFVFAWQYVGFNTVLYLAGLQGIARDLYEAAELDGAGWWQRFRYITLPQLAPTTFFVIATTGILTLQLFGEAVVLFPTNQPIGSGPANSTITPVVYLYDQGFRRFSQGYASAVAWVLFFLIFLFTYVQFRRQRAESGV